MTRRELLNAFKAGALSQDELLRRLKALSAPAAGCPLSVGQAGLWLLHRLDPASSAYNVPICMELAKPLDAGLLSRALEAVVEQHPILASAIEIRNEEPWLVPQPRGAALVEVDATGLSAAELDERVVTVAKTPFELERGPMIRCRLFNCRGGSQVLLIVVHHIVFDGRSVRLLLQALFAAYRALAAGGPGLTAHVPATYADFVAWERQMLAGPDGQSHVEYWRRQLDGAPSALDLPTDRPRQASKRTRGATHAVAVSEEVRDRIRHVCGTHDLTPGALMLALYKTLLFRHSGETDLVVGVPSLGRPQARFDEVIGYFVNMIPVRTSIAGAMRFGDFARTVGTVLAEGLDHAACPFPTIVRESRVSRSAGRHPVFQVAFEYQSSRALGFDSIVPSGADGPDARPRNLHQEGEYELVLEIYEDLRGLRLNFKYDQELFLPATIERMAQHYLRLLDGVLDDPDRALSDYALMAEAERRRILEDFNRTGDGAGADETIVTLFRRQAGARPDRIALRFGDQTMTYAELDRRSDALAYALRRAGVGEDQPVGICLERSLELVVALLGALKSGACYVPLDPRYPIERVRFMIEDSGLTVLVTERDVIEALGDAAAKVRRVSVEGMDPVDRQVPAAPAAESLAYIIYTSGSTGRPKGVMVSHRALANFLLGMADRPGINGDDRLLAVTTPSFDIAALELYLPLIAGAECRICASDTVRDAAALRREVEQYRPTIMQATPATWTLLLRAGWRNPHRTRLLCGGEPLPEALKDELLSFGAELWNLYGPTETTVWSTAGLMKAGRTTTIGAPIANTKVYVVDDQLAPVPIGVPGELLIGGAGLARGYWRQPKLTEERFVTSPFLAGQRLYRTGDLACWTEAGELKHLGRLDAQVKLRGFRVEPGEIEARLGAQPDVGACAVVAVDRSGHDRQLVAFCVPASSVRRPDPIALRAALRKALPEYMVPARFEVVSTLPLTPSGKVDRKRLAQSPLRQEPAPVTDAGRNAESAAGSIETTLLAIWRDVLQTDAVGPEDGFFDAGGDSLRALTAAQRISRTLNVPFEVEALFRFGTVRAIAQHLRDLAPVPATPSSAKATDSHAAVTDELRGSLAIIGMSCEFPGARNHHEFWRNLTQGVSSIERLDAADLRSAGVPEELIRSPSYVPVRAAISSRASFDADFFKVSHKDAALMDPQARLLLQHAWRAIEDAGYAPRSIPATGVFVSTSNNGYQGLTSGPGLDLLASANGYLGWLLTQPGTAATLISHRLGLTGPSYAVHSNCSSSLAALYAAQQAIIAGDAHCALVGAATVFLGPAVGYVHRPGLNFSSDGRVKTFDASADGMVGGEGVAMLFVKRADRAVADGDSIYAVIRGVAVNNDGAGKAGFFAPSERGQAAVIEQALRRSGVRADDIGYIEAHGTGTALGDPIELAALRAVYGVSGGRGRRCGIGSVKSNIGHLDTAAGLAGCIKVALSLQRAEIPATLNYQSPNPRLQLESSPFYVVGGRTPWSESPRRAALSSFGIGGTNSHAVLEEAPPRPKPPESGGPYAVVLSAQTAERLQAVVRQLVAFLQDPVLRGDLRLEDIAYTLQVGREPLSCRVAFVVSSLSQLLDELSAYASGSARIPEAGRSEAEAGIVALVQNWLKGASVDWEQLYPAGRPVRVSLPTYPFAEQAFWPELSAPQATAPVRPTPPVADHQHRARGIAISDDAGKLHALTDRLRACLASQLRRNPADIEDTRPFTDYGVDSMAAVAIVGAMNAAFGADLPNTALFEHANLIELARHLHERETSTVTAPRHSTRRIRKPAEGRLAVIGMGGRFPGADSPDELWANLVAGKDAIEEVPMDRWSLDDFYVTDRQEAVARRRSYSKLGGFLKNIDHFDLDFFGLSVADALALGPKDLLFLEAAWHAVESAGYTREALRAQAGPRVGVFAGAMPGTQHYFGVGGQRNSHIPQLSISGAANLVSGFFDLRGPSISVDTQSSSSMTAVHMACEAISRGECELAIAGGVSLLYPELYYVFSHLGLLGSRRDSRSFTAGDGGLFSEAVGAIVIKSLGCALADGDPVLGIIHSTVATHSGRGNATRVPSVQSQSDLFAEAIRKAAVDPRTISFVESAAYGAEIGDAIEVAALTRAFREFTHEPHFCALGSVKSHIGHAEAASGITQIIKVLLQFRNRQLVPLLHAAAPNPNLRLDGSPFRLQRELQEWLPAGGAGDGDRGRIPRRALVNSFGAGGAYACALLEEPPMPEAAPDNAEPQLIVLSARSRPVLDVMCLRLREWLHAAPSAWPEARLRDVAYTLQVGREALPIRCAIVATSLADLQEQLTALVAAPDAPRPDVGQRVFHGEAAKMRVSGPEQAVTMPPPLEESLAKCDLATLAQHWVQGGDVRWDALPGGTDARRIALPTYPFERRALIGSGPASSDKPATTPQADGVAKVA